MVSMLRTGCSTRPEEKAASAGSIAAMSGSQRRAARTLASSRYSTIPPSRSIPRELRAQDECATSAPLGPTLLRRVDDEPGARIDPDKLVVNGFHARRVLDRDLERKPLAGIEDRAGDMDDPVLDLDADAARGRPFLMRELGEDALLDGAVIESLLAPAARGHQSPQQVGTRHHADDGIAA